MEVLTGAGREQTDFSFSGFAPGSDWRIVFHIEGFLTLAGTAGVVEEQLRIGLGVCRNEGCV